LIVSDKDPYPLGHQVPPWGRDMLCGFTLCS
jgi:hypothetical protein